MLETERAQVAQCLAASAAERDPESRIQLLLRAQAVLVHCDTPVDQVETYLGQVLVQHGDASVAVRRYVAHFADRFLFAKPAFALRCLPAVSALLRDEDVPV